MFWCRQVGIIKDKSRWASAGHMKGPGSRWQSRPTRPGAPAPTVDDQYLVVIRWAEWWDSVFKVNRLCISISCKINYWLYPKSMRDEKCCLFNVHINWKAHSDTQTIKMWTNCASRDQATLAAHRRGTFVTLNGQVTLTSPQLSPPLCCW